MLLREILEDVSHFLKQFNWIFEFANTRVLSENHLDRVPAEWTQNCFSSSCTLKNLKDRLTTDCGDPTFNPLVAQRNNLLRDLKSKLGMPEEMVQTNGTKVLPDEMTRNMTEKKLGEVRAVAHRIGQQCQDLGIQHVVDVGSGLAYLPQALSLLYGLKVLCLECNQGHLNRAQRRVSADANIQVVKCFLEDTDEGVQTLQEVILKFCGKQKIFMSGLHCCGDLTPTMLRIFSKLETISSLLVLSCCYQKMATGFDSRNAPMSSCLRDEKSHITFSPFLLRAGGQEICEKWLHQEESEHSKHSRVFGYRALMEEFCVENSFVVRKTHRQGVGNENYCEDPLTFATRFYQQYDVAKQCDDVNKFVKEFNAFCSARDCEVIFETLEKLTGLQLFLQPLIEYLILGDRILFMYDEGLTNVAVCEMFPDSISPRNKAILCSRSFSK